MKELEKKKGSKRGWYRDEGKRKGEEGALQQK